MEIPTVTEESQVASPAETPAIDEDRKEREFSQYKNFASEH